MIKQYARRWGWSARWLPTVMLLAGCGMSFDETHYFTSVQQSDGVPVNFFRVKVQGDSGFSSARYISGFYDERAVDLFFNEIQVAKEGEEPNRRALFPADLKDPGTDVKLQPLSPGAEHGAFVMILSTNADTIVSTIGAFAENNVVGDAVANLVNQDDIKEARRSDGELGGKVAASQALVNELESMFGKVPDDQAGMRRQYLAILDRVALELGVRDDFTTLGDAAAAFSRPRRRP